MYSLRTLSNCICIKRIRRATLCLCVSVVQCSVFLTTHDKKSRLTTTIFNFELLKPFKLLEPY